MFYELSNNKFSSNQEANKAMELAIGRLFLLGSRPFQEGDIQQYEDLKSVFLDAADFNGLKLDTTDRNSYQANYSKIYHD